ncbi:MAG: hypothetical protein Q9195_007500 [Heterodermia aff. obscurata]
MSQNQSENPLIKALPPETDYLSYLTIVEYNINEDQLPTLHQVLQDTTLTTNIGWDLVHLLLPLLPHSKLCLQDVARLGNPREVVLKVTELLEKLGGQDEEDEDLGSEDGEDTLNPGEVESNDGEAQNGTTQLQPSSIEVQFCALLDMLQTLLPRIKTKFPSCFLSTSLQALLPAYAKIAAEEQATEAVIVFIKALSGTSRPTLPPRASSTSVPTQNNDSHQSAPDPEGNDGSIGIEEEALQKRLLQAFLTFVFEAYMTALPLVEDVPGMAWCSRIQEYRRPDSVIPGRRTFTELFDSGQGYLHNRDAIVGQFIALSRDLSLSLSALLTTLITPPSPPSTPTDLPSTASEVPLSLPGALYLLTASSVASILFGVPSTLPSIRLFPHYASIVAQLIGVSSPVSAGTEPLALIDAILALHSCINIPNEDNDPDSETSFKETLQRLSLLSANTPNASLRYRAHVVTKNILYSYPSENVRMAYIKDTLQNCPYENLKASAVGWLKDEIIADGRKETRKSIFANPEILKTLAPYLCLNPYSLNHKDDFTPFLAYQSFFLAVLNLMYLILSSQNLNVSSWDLIRCTETWIQQLKEVTNDIREVIKVGGEEGEDAIEGLEMDLRLLEGNANMVEEALKDIYAAEKNREGSG